MTVRTIHSSWASTCSNGGLRLASWCQHASISAFSWVYAGPSVSVFCGGWSGHDGLMPSTTFSGTAIGDSSENGTRR